MNETRPTMWKMFLLAPLFLVLGLLFVRPATAEDSLDLQKAVKIGSGKTMVVEFTDPDCPFCHKAEGYFQGKTQQVTRYLFFFPLRMHPDAKTKVQYILSAKDKTKAYQDVLAGRFDKSRAEAAITQEGIDLQQEHMKIAGNYNVEAVPTFIIYGRIVKGLDRGQLDELIK